MSLSILDFSIFYRFRVTSPYRTGQTNGQDHGRSLFFGLGAITWPPSARSRDRAPGRGQGAKPPEAESICKTVTKAMLEFFNVRQLIAVS